MNLVLNLTEHCNLRCSYCYYRTSPQVSVMTKATLEQAIDFAFARMQFLKQNWLNITFFGGEPLLEAELMMYGVHYAKSRAPQGMRLQFAINTNGTLLTENILDFLQQQHFRIYLSLDGPQSVHDLQRPCKDGTSSWASIAPWIPRLRALDTLVIRVIDRRHLENIASSIEWIYEQGLVMMTTAINYDGGWTDVDWQTLESQYRLMGLFWMQAKKSGQRLQIGTFQDKIRLELEKRTCKTSSCEIGNGALAVSVHGELFPCTRFVNNDIHNHWKIGTLEQGLQQEKLTEIAKYLHTDKVECQECSIRNRCHGNGCACIAFSTTGGIWEVSPEVCAHERMITEISDELALELLS